MPETPGDPFLKKDGNFETSVDKLPEKYSPGHYPSGPDFKPKSGFGPGTKPDFEIPGPYSRSLGEKAPFSDLGRKDFVNDLGKALEAEEERRCLREKGPYTHFLGGQVPPLDVDQKMGTITPPAKAKGSIPKKP